MSELVELEIAPREVVGKATKHLRKAGIIPANIFGHGQPSQAVQVRSLEFARLRRSHKSTNILTLKLPNAATETALIRRVQHDPRTGHVVHIDFFRVNMSERVTIKVALHFEGDAPAVKNYSGVLLHLLDALEIECVASDIIAYMVVDITSLKEIDDTLYARDVKLPPNYVLVTNPDEPIVKVAGTRAEKTTETAEAATPATATPATEK